MLVTLSVFSLSSVAFSQGPAHPTSLPVAVEKEANKPGNSPDHAALVSGTEALTMPMQATRLRQKEQQTRMDSRTAFQQSHLHQNEQFPNPFSSAPRLVAQENPGDIPLAGVEMVSSMGGSCYGLTMQDNIVYLGEGINVTILDVSDATNPQKLAAISLPDMVWDMDIEGSLLFVANDEIGGVQIVDISNPASPHILGSYDTPGQALRVDAVGERVYVADALSGLHILDVSDPTTPTLLGSYTDVGAITGVQVDNSIAYVSDYYLGLLVLDVSNLSATVLIGSYATPQQSWNLQLVDNKIYMTHYVPDVDPDLPNDELHIIDVSNPSAPTVVGTYTGLAAVQNLFVADGLAYVAQGNELKIIDISDPSSPNPISSYSVSGDTKDVVVQNGQAYFVSDTGGLFIVDVSQPVNPKPLASYTVIGQISDVSVDNGKTYIAARENGLHIIDQQNNQVGTFPVHSDFRTVNMVEDIAVAGTTAYVAIQNVKYRDDEETIDDSASTSTLHIYDISTPTTPILLGNYTVQQYAVLEVEVAGTLAYFLVNDTLYVLDISNPSAPQERNKFSPVWGMYIDQTTAYLATEDGLSVLDMSDPASPTIIGETTHISGDAIMVQNGKIYIGYRNYVVIVDVNPASTTFMETIGWYQLPNEKLLTYDIVVANDLVYSISSPSDLVYNISNPALSSNTILSIIDVSNPVSPTLQSVYTNTAEWQGFSTHIATTGNYVYVATGLNRIDILDVSDPTNPQFAALHETSPSSEYSIYGRVSRMSIVDNRAFPAAGIKGFEILDINDPVAPTYIGGQTNTTMSFVDKVMVDGDTAYLIGDELNIIDVQDFTAPRLLANYQTGFSLVVDICVQDVLLYTAEAGRGLRILDISTPTHPKVIGQYEISNRLKSMGIIVQNNIAYVVYGVGDLVSIDESGLIILDVEDPSDIKLLGEYQYDTTTMGSAHSVQVRDKIAYVIDIHKPFDYNGPTGLRIIDVANSTAPELLSYGDTSPYEPLDLALEDDTVYLTITNLGVRVFDISNPANPVLQEEIPMPGSAQSIQKVSDILHVANWNAGYQEYYYTDGPVPDDYICLPLIKR